MSATCDALSPANLAGLTNTDPTLTYTTALGYYVPGAGSPAIGTGVGGVGTANFDIPVLDDDPNILYDITGRLRGGGAYDLGCAQVSVLVG